MRKIKYITAVIFGVLGATLAFAQDELVVSPKANDVAVGRFDIKQDRALFNMTYLVLLGDNVLNANIELLISLDGGKTFEPAKKYGKIAGDIGLVKEAGTKVLRYDISDSREFLADKDIAFKLNVKSKDVLKSSVLVLAEVAPVPQPSYGLMIGYVKKWGGYLKVRSNFVFPKTSLVCTSDGKVEGGGTIWTTGQTKLSNLNITAGGMYRATKWLYPYIGAGYGSRKYYWEDHTGAWATVKDYSFTGVSVDAGAVLKFGMFACSVGVSNIMFKHTEFEVGIGVIF